MIVLKGFTKDVENIIEGKEIELQDPQINEEEKEEKFDIYQWIKGIYKLERFHFFNPFTKKLLSNLELTILMTEKTLLKDSIIFPSMNEYYLYDPNQGIYLKYDEVGYRILIGGILDKFSITPDFRQVSSICNNFKVGKKSKTNNVHTNLKNDMICFTNCVLNLSTRISEPHSPNYFLITRLEFEYQPENKTIPNFTNYINSLCDDFPDRVTLLRSWFWLLIHNETSTQTFLYMLGRCSIERSIFGHICTALEHYRLAVLKQVVSGDPFKARVKKGSYDIYPRGLVLIIGNHGLGSLPSIERRLRLFIADNVIDVKDTKPLLYNHQGRWKGLLSTELPGIFNWIYNFSKKEAISYMENTMHFVPSLKTDYLDNQVQLNPMKNWVEEELEQGKGAFLGFHTSISQMEDQKRGLLIPAYVRYCKKRNIHPITHVRFSRELLSTCKTLKWVATKQRLKEGIYIKGIQLKKFRQGFLVGANE